MKIALCYIVKDDSEVESLKNSIISAINYVDSLHIVANGKKTTDIEHLTSFTSSKYPKKQVTYNYLPWNDDFSEQRNYSFSLVPEDTDYIFWMDADDILVGGEHLKKVAEIGKKRNMDTIFLKYWYGCTFNGEPTLENLVEVDIEHYRERLMKPGAITWKKRIHETPVPVSGKKENYSKVPYSEEFPIAIMHTIGLDESEAKMERNRRLLEKELADERNQGEPDPRTILYLMKIYAEIGDKQILEQCIELGHEYLGLSGWDEERGNALDIMAICSSKLNQYKQAIQYLHRAIEEYPYEPIHYVRLALAYYNDNQPHQAKHWLHVAGQLDLKDDTSGVKNIKELKVLFAQLSLKIAFNVDKDLEASLQAAEALYKEQPIDQNKENILHIKDRYDLYKASEHAKEVITYLTDIESSTAIKVLDELPRVIREQPWAIKSRQQLTQPRVWGDDEICYFANFGGKHFEKWDGNSIGDGIGGSETAVIRLSEAWVKQGYKVTVYGDPVEPVEINGVTYLPWYYFNKGDKHNIFIQWRSGHLAPVIKAKRFLVDLHDVVNQVDYNKQIMDAVDGVLFKSQYHADMLPDLSDNKKLIIGNGI